MRVMARALRAEGYQIVSSWIAQRGPTPTDSKRCAKIGGRDLDDVKKCDLLICDLSREAHNGAREGELAAALILGREVWVVGTGCVGNVFRHMATRTFPGWAE